MALLLGSPGIEALIFHNQVLEYKNKHCLNGFIVKRGTGSSLDPSAHVSDRIAKAKAKVDSHSFIVYKKGQCRSDRAVTDWVSL